MVLFSPSCSCAIIPRWILYQEIYPNQCRCCTRYHVQGVRRHSEASFRGEREVPINVLHWLLLMVGNREPEPVEHGRTANKAVGGIWRATEPLRLKIYFPDNLLNPSWSPFPPFILDLPETAGRCSLWTLNEPRSSTSPSSCCGTRNSNRDYRVLHMTAPKRHYSTLIFKQMWMTMLISMCININVLSSVGNSPLFGPTLISMAFPQS